MVPSEYIQRRQQFWARRKGIGLRARNPVDPSSEPNLDREMYVTNLRDNLYEPLHPESLSEFERGDGGELHTDGRISNMYAVHSSSALFANAFDYWRRSRNLTAIARALKIPSTDIQTLSFEAKVTIDPSFERAPNLDGLFTYDPKTKLKAVGIESKFSEPYSSRKAEPLSTRYLDPTLWHDLPESRKLAETLSQESGGFLYLGASQLLKHVLGLVKGYEREGFRLLYLWYAVPHPDCYRHADEINRFKEVVAADCVNFTALTYQELMLRLTDQERSHQSTYVNYLCERYL